MATIQSTLSLNDQMTPTLSKAEKQAIANIKAYNKLGDAINKMQEQMGDLDRAGLSNTDMFKGLRSASETLANEMRQYEDGTKNAEIAQDGLNASQGNGVGSATELNPALEVLQKAWSALCKVMQEANEWMEVSNEQFNAQYEAAIKLHNKLGASDEEIMSMYQYAGALQEVGVAGDEAAIAAMGTLATYADNLEQVKQLIPAILDLAVAENGTETSMTDVTSAAQKVGYALNGNATMLKRLIGATDAEIDTLNNMNDKTEKAAYLYELLNRGVGGANETLAKTARGGIMQANNALGDMQERLGDMVIPYVNALEQAFVQIITPIMDFVEANASWLIPTVMAVIGVVAALIVVMTILQIVNYLVALSEMACFWPLLLIIAAIGVIIGLTVLIVNQINKATGSAISAAGAVAGVFAVLGAYLYNNFIMPTWNSIAKLVNFLANCFKDPIASVKILFLQMAEFILDAIYNVVKGIIDLINMIPGVEISVSDSFTGLVSWVKDEIKATKEGAEWEDVVEELDRIDYGDAYNAGYDFGSNLANNISAGIDSLSMDNLLGSLGGGIGDLTEGLDNLTGVDSAGGAALKTTTNDDLISDEDIQLLLDVATRDYKLSYQQVTPTITLTFGDVRETADVDDILNTVADRLEEIYDANLEVVSAG